jgi:hypothetical protein
MRTSATICAPVWRPAIRACGQSAELVADRHQRAAMHDAERVHVTIARFHLAGDPVLVRRGDADAKMQAHPGARRQRHRRP